MRKSRPRAGPGTHKTARDYRLAGRGVRRGDPDIQRIVTEALSAYQRQASATTPSGSPRSSSPDDGTDTRVESAADGASS